MKNKNFLKLAESIKQAGRIKRGCMRPGRIFKAKKYELDVDFMGSLEPLTKEEAKVISGFFGKRKRFTPKVLKDEIIEEVRRIRHAHAARFGFDLGKIHDDIVKKEKADRRRGFKYVSLANRKSSRP